MFWFDWWIGISFSFRSCFCGSVGILLSLRGFENGRSYCERIWFFSLLEPTTISGLQCLSCNSESVAKTSNFLNLVLMLFILETTLFCWGGLFCTTLGCNYVVWAEFLWAKRRLDSGIVSCQTQNDRCPLGLRDQVSCWWLSVQAQGMPCSQGVCLVHWDWFWWKFYLDSIMRAVLSLDGNQS